MKILSFTVDNQHRLGVLLSGERVLDLTNVYPTALALLEGGEVAMSSILSAVERAESGESLAGQVRMLDQVRLRAPVPQAAASGAYVGAGAGATFYQASVSGPAPLPADGKGWTPTAAAMAGVTYDAGSWVADLGYRLLYLPKLSNYATAGDTWYVNDSTIHEVRGTLRYRFQ